MSAPTSSGRRKCPKCGSPNTKQSVDKTKPPLTYTGMGEPIYPKYFKCGECGEKWE